nr:PREDICTED: condensin-2 complex subunit H2 isoform X1 [Lepisosteus oculatus]
MIGRGKKMINDSAKSRFNHLLQPIRDLSKNWEVNVAAELEEYLDELDQIPISFDDGATTMNFAEAALLIQGSACVYSKKVEYLYSLVYRALDFISNKKRDKQAPSVGRDGVDNDATFAYRNDDEELLSLDDIGDNSKTNCELRKEIGSKTLTIAPLTPLALSPPDEENKINLLSNKCEILASYSDFRMHNSTPHGNGTFLLVAAGDTSQSLWNLQINHKDNSVVHEDAMDVNRMVLQEVSDHEALEPALNISGEDAGQAFDPQGDDNEMDVEVGPVHDIHIERHQISGDRRMLRERPPVPSENEKDKVLEILDPWKSLDPFKASEDKPLKKGRYYIIPQRVQEVEGNKRKRKVPNKLLDFLKWFSGVSSESSGRKIKKGPTFADLEELHCKQVKEKLAAQKMLKRKTGTIYFEKCNELQNKELVNAEEQNEAEEVRHDDYLDNDEGGDFSDHEDFAEDCPAQRAEDLEVVATAPEREGSSYEDLILKHVELFIAESQKYAQETALSLKIKEWENKMGPHLTAQEERLAFDIHDYGGKIISAFDSVGERRTFASIVKGKEEYEVCRYMLASLQLANDYTVEIHEKTGLEESLDSMALTLLSKRQAHERFKTYTAPSISETT